MRTLIAAMLVLAVCTPVALARKWTDSTGKYSLEAELVDVKEGKVLLKREGGTIVSVPLEKLSTADQDFVKKAGSQTDEAEAGTTPQSASKAVPKPARERVANARNRRPDREMDPLDQLLAKIKNKGANPFTVKVTGAQSGFGMALAVGLVKADAKLRLKDCVASVRRQHQERQAVDAVLRLIQETRGETLPEDEYKAICFLATEALAQLSTTSGEALGSLEKLQSHRDPVISSQAKLQMVFLKAPRKAAPGR